ncbi:tRNA 4-thiouridine(8) synthase ThiI [Candidatus Uhrbacteria bacterium RIFCSPLOWO2_01_FULL_53_9]|uniref:Probable tRNA sulfurtransferase n=2 Tax=Candidatus Uhriibacteriota TaxID=1752732 RepID=A0A1F7UYR8_9BACT|nr:MAG: tRNA 4-thiouridine(8) synthase ThiI [Candidatus Uhrbacteria bacterium RIFCSPHIGHO2_02_FULL_53_13]OGL83411.1 MAG: tRNA 4-thiouridine(8) synthase ThiI [Candidatus Uhrbacteria bacterium RIFCSPLOWO2_01_FULL_53_9]
MKHVVVIRYGEIALKGKNRDRFEQRLIQNIEHRLVDRGLCVKKRYGRLIMAGDVMAHEHTIRSVLAKTFGVENFSFGVMTAQELFEIEQGVQTIIEPLRNTFQTFRVTAVRQDKTFTLTSMELSKRLGGVVLVACLGKRVQMKGADMEVFVEVTTDGVYLSAKKERGPGGIPMGITGRVLALLSGGIDSPVAAWYMMKRGCRVDFIHFHSIPYTDRASVEKVRELAAIVNTWQGESELIEEPMLEMQKRIMTETHEKYRVLLYRRHMLRVAEAHAKRLGAKALVTGESLGQVASQTLENMIAVAAAADMPVLRPLIGFDKSEIMAKAQTIGTFETSILPHQDCCTLFTPRHPATKARAEDLAHEEEKLL